MSTNWSPPISMSLQGPVKSLPLTDYWPCLKVAGSPNTGTLIIDGGSGGGHTIEPGQAFMTHLGTPTTISVPAGQTTDVTCYFAADWPAGGPTTLRGKGRRRRRGT
jgi:hypothetical protein